MYYLEDDAIEVRESLNANGSFVLTEELVQNAIHVKLSFQVRSADKISDE